jgi:hypothetical protein
MVEVRGKVYFRQTRQEIDSRNKECNRYIWLYHSDKSAMTEHITSFAHRIQFNNTSNRAKRVRVSLVSIVAEVGHGRLGFEFW